RIVGQQYIAVVVAAVAGALAFERVVVDAAAVDVAHEDAVAVAVRPVVAKVDHAAGVGVAAAGLVVGAFAAARFGPVAAAPVDVVGTAFHQAVKVRIEI